jgi:4-oxalomesaconate hydratase
MLVISAHVADFCSRSGGTIAKYVKRGSSVRAVNLTYGERGESNELWLERPDLSLEEVKEIRKQESERAAEVLGVEIRFLDWDDNPLIIGEERLLHLVDEIREMRPHIVLTHHSNEPLNIDHGFTSRSVIEAISLVSYPGLRTAYAPAPRPVLFFFEATIPMTEFEGFNPNVYIDITDVLERKMEALKQFKTQSFLPRRYGEYAAFRGFQAATLTGNVKIEYAEAFEQYLPSVGNEFSLAGRYFPL